MFKQKKNFMASFYGWGSTASRLEPLRGGSLLFTTKSPEYILLLAVSPELYSIIKCAASFLVMGWGLGEGEIEPATNFLKSGGGESLSGSQLWGLAKKFDFRGVHEKPIYRKGIV